MDRSREFPNKWCKVNIITLHFAYLEPPSGSISSFRFELHRLRWQTDRRKVSLGWSGDFQSVDFLHLRIIIPFFVILLWRDSKSFSVFGEKPDRMSRGKSRKKVSSLPGLR
jgi:hypothetical protein